MRHEVVCGSNTITDKELQSIQHITPRNSLIIVNSGQLKQLKRATNIRALVDFPYGINDTELRVNEIEHAVKHGAMGIDIPISPVSLLDNQPNRIMADLKACVKTCQKHEIPMRVMIEYRLIEHGHTCEVAQMCAKSGVDGIIFGTGTLPDNPADMILLANTIYSGLEESKKTHISLSIHKTSLTKKQETAAFSAGISSIRHCYHFFSEIFGKNPNL